MLPCGKGNDDNEDQNMEDLDDTEINGILAKFRDAIINAQKTFADNDNFGLLPSDSDVAVKARRVVTLLKQLSRSYVQEAKSGISHSDRIRGYSAIDDMNKFRDQVEQELSLISNELEEFTGEGDTSGGDDFTRDDVLSEFWKYIVRAHDALRDNAVFEILPFSSDIVVKAGRVLQLLMRLFNYYTNTSNSQISEGHIYQ